MNRFLRNIKRNRHGRRNVFVDPEEIFLDSQNLPDFDTQQFEGQMERPIKRRSLMSIAALFVLIIVLFGGRLYKLQISQGEYYTKQSDNNSLDREPIFAARGNIYDRNGVPLAWNNAASDDNPWGARSYIAARGFSHILGYVGYPKKDNSGNFWQTQVVGKDGAEKMFNALLTGENGSRIVEKDIAGNLRSGALVNQPVPGKNITLTIDSRLQAKMSETLHDYAARSGFRSASAIMIDVRTGEIITMTSLPEYDSETMALGTDKAKIREYLTSPSTPLLNRAISGLFTPGSIVKPYVAMEVLKQGVIPEYKQICSCGYITIPNPYDPSRPSIFRDFNPNNGMVDIRHAIAVSSNIFFMETTGGYRDQRGIGISNLEKALIRFGLTQKTGIDLLGERSGSVPSPEWKAKKFDGEPWRVGDTYNTAIGQYGVQVTPIEMARALAAMARRGVLVTPHVLKDDGSGKGSPAPETKVEELPDHYYQVVHEGMHLGATEGTGRILATLPFAAASKTGTAQVGVGGKYINVWMTTFFPYENPHYGLVVVLEHGPQSGIAAAQHTIKDFLDWVVLNAPEYTQ